MLLTGGVVILLIMIGYFVFEYVVRRPLIQVTNALDAEASGVSFPPMSKAKAEEIRILLDAFHNMREQVRSRQARLESILSSAAEGVISIDRYGVIETFNSAAEKLFGYNRDEVIGENISILVPNKIKSKHDDYIKQMNEGKIFDIFDMDRQVQAQRKDGSVFPISLKVGKMDVSGELVYTVMLDDVSERMEMIKNLRYLAEHDSLTGLYNRYFFLNELERVVERSNRGVKVDIALLYIDLDNFKYINDTLGHLAGDKLLIEVSDIFKHRSRKSDLICRLGGDEFAVILYDVEVKKAKNVADSLRIALQNYNFSFEGKMVDVGCSVGIAVVSQGLNRDELLAQVDYACNVAKREGRNMIHLYTKQDQKDLNTMSDDIGWTRRIKDAIKNDRFIIVMQPIMDAESGNIHRYEVLIRMLDDDGKFIMPSGFIAPAERFGLMTEIDKWIIKRSINILTEELKLNSNIQFSINLSATSFVNNDLIEFITVRIWGSGIDPSSITFEVTETAAMADVSLAVEFLDKLRQLGCKTALDDFGVVYSSFAYLKNLPVDAVKIDGSFIKDIETNNLHKAIVKSMHDVAHAMGKKV